jgi:hypothetical protein
MKYESRLFLRHSDYCDFLKNSDIEIISVNMVKPEIGYSILLTFLNSEKCSEDSP